MEVVKGADKLKEDSERKMFEDSQPVLSPSEVEAKQSHEAAKLAMEKYRANLIEVAKEYGQLYVIASKYGEESLLEHAYGVWQILLYVECVTGEMTAKTQAEAHEHIGKYISDKFVALWPVDPKTKKPIASFINAVRGDLMAYEMRSGKATVTLMEVYHNSPKVFTQDVVFAISLANRLTITAGRLHRERMLEINPEIQN
jgi:hypothetical protein